MVVATPTPFATTAPVATAAPRAVTSKSLNVVLTPLPQDTFFPWKATSSGHLVFRPIIENPTTIDPRTGVSTVLPQLFTEWDMSPNGQNFTFKIRKGVQFHNDWGEYTVKDFIYNVDSAVQDGSLTGCAATFKAFMGTKTATEMKAAGDLVVIDDYNFTMHTARPQVTW